MKNTKAMKELADKMDLELPKYYLEIDRYELEGNQIVIKSIKVLDADGNFLRFAKNEKLINHIHEYPIKFKPHSND